MATLTGCLRKAGDALPQRDRVALLERARALRASGVTNADAGRQAVAELIASVEAEIRGMAVGGPESAAQEPEPAAAGKAEPAKGGKIEDFGEKLTGARKDYAATLQDAQAVDIAAEPLSKSWPEPDYDKLLSGGADPFVVAFVHAARDEMPTKPQKSWKLKGWVEGVKSLRETSRSLLAGEVEPDKARKIAAAGGQAMKAVLSRAELYELVGHGKSLRGISFAENHYSWYKGQENVRKWVVEQKAKATAFSNWPRELAVADTKQAMLDQFAAKFMAQEGGDDGTKAPAKGQFVIYRKRGQEGAFIGKKIGREYIDLHKAADVAAAREYLSNSTAALEKALEKYRETPFERKTDNAPRVGDDHRNGAPVTPEVFADTFGFRGVQFGNYVEQGRRQSDLNEAYDGLMDLAAVLGLPPRALSLNGRLGLAFGARGRGGKNAPAAHYEPDNVVINLTKGGGPGSLAHELWHGMDNYFAANSGSKSGYVTGGSKTDGMRDALKVAFDHVKTATQLPTLRKRAAELDKRKSKPYWNTPIELSARAFESYVIAKLQDQGAANDYLANVVDEKVWNIGEEARAELITGGQPAETYPYPLQAEMPVVRAAFDDFFKTVETRSDDTGSVAMFSRAPSTQAAYEARIDELFAGEKAKVGTRVLDRSDVMVLLGYPDVPLMLNERHLLDGLASHPEMTAEAWKQVPQWLEDPAAVYTDPAHPGRLTMIAPQRLAGYPVLMVVEPNAGNVARGKGGAVPPEQLLVTVFAKTTGGLPWLGGLAVNGRLLYADTKTAPVIWQRAGDIPRAGGQASGAKRILTQKNLAGYRRENQPPSPDVTASRRRRTTGISMRDAEAVKGAVQAALPNAPEIILHDVVNKAPDDLVAAIRAEGAQDDVEAVYWRGQIHVFPSNIASIERAEFVIGRHEIRHHGMRTRYGGKLDEVLMSMWRANPDLRKATQAIVDGGRARRNERAKAIEEALADMPVERIAQLRNFDKLVATVRQWLRQMAASLRRRGFTTLAGAIDPNAWTDNDVAVFVLKAEQVSGEAGQLAAPMDGQEARFSRATDAVAALGRIDQRAVRNAAHDLLSSPGKVSWWDKTIGTQYAKAEKYAKHGDTAGFKTVFDAVQDYHEDISTLANEAADAAPTILPKLDGWRDLAKSGLSKEDSKAVAAPMFEGTLEWARNADGELVRIDDLEAAAEKMDVHDKAQALFAAGRITEPVLKMWRGLPIEQFETIVGGKYEREFLQAGAVFTPDELRSQFKLTDRQIGQYQQIRNAIDTSLDQAGTADVLRLLKDAPQDFKRMAMENRAEFRKAVFDFLDTQEDAGGDLRSDIQDKFDRIDSLKAHGYAPLMRFGKFFVDVKSKETGESLYFGLYESRREANAALRDMRAAFPEGDASAGVISQQAHKLFSGIPLESLEMFAQAIGATDSDVYQQYIKLAKNNRSAMKRLLKRKGTAGFTEDPTRVLAAFLTSNARLASGSMNLLGASQAAQEIKAGDVKDEAIKLIEAVQNPTETAAAIRGFMFVNFIGGSVASAVVNLTQTMTMTLPYLTQWGGLAKATGHWSAALRQAVHAVDDKTELGKALKQAEADGIVSPQEIHHLQAEAMGSWGTNPALKKAAFVWGSMFSLAEQFNRRVTFIAAYNTAREQNMADPFAFAEKAVVETQGLYNRGNSANWARNPVGAAALQFKQFTTHYLEWLQRMWQSGPQGKRAVGYALAVLMLAAGSGGLPGSDDLDDLIDTLAQALGYDFSSKAAKERFLASMLGKAGAEFVTRGISGVAGMPIDVSLRMGMGNLIPATGLLLRSNTDSARDLSEVAGAAGGMFRQVKEASEKALAGDFAGAAVKASPMAIQNMAKGVEVWTTGQYRDTRGRKVMDADMVDGLMKFIGFQPAAVAAETDKIRQTQRSEAFAKKVESDIVAKWARGLVDGEPDVVLDAQQELRSWNQKNPGSPIRINRSQVSQRARKMRESRAERFNKTVAPERRALVAQ